MPAPLLQLTDIALTFGGDPVFSDLSLIVDEGDRVALVGRNGSGKSTLMKVMAGLVEADRGDRVLRSDVNVSYMEQDPDFSGFETLGAFAEAGVEAADHWHVAQAAEGLGFDPATPVATASGGERRRAALARLLAQAPDLMLLDEPTNHLDIAAIEWLEGHLADTRAAFVLISHDRALLNKLTRATLWIDRGQVRRQDKGFAHFEAWRDKTWSDEDIARHKLDRKIKAEARWAVEGISARRKRNQGRVRALAELRKTRAEMIRRQGTAALAADEGQKSGKKVIEAKGLSHGFEGKPIVRDFDLTVLRGDRVAFVGPNGVGKTTLLGLLTGTLTPDQGHVKLGTKLEMAVFDQSRAQLDPDATLWDSLTLDQSLGVRGSSDQVMVRGAPRHVVGYLKDFLFSEAQARAPVRSLSGGEKARLLLAKILARPSNVLVLDEPTNDLDVETLDLMQEVLDDYPGTVLLVSHDRDFLDRVASLTVALEGDGRADVYPGGWSDYRRQRRDRAPEAASVKPIPRKEKAEKAPAPKATGLSFTEQHRLQALPAEIERLEAEIAKLTDFLSDPDLFTREPKKFEKASAGLVERQSALAAAEEEWLSLEERAQT